MNLDLPVYGMTMIGFRYISKIMKNWFIKVWNRIQWLVTELVNTCSDKPSYFSKKRIQAWLLFDSGLGCMLYWFFTHVDKMTYGEIIAFASVLFGAAGYQIQTIQKEKRFNKNNKL